MSETLSLPSQLQAAQTAAGENRLFQGIQGAIQRVEQAQVAGKWVTQAELAEASPRLWYWNSDIEGENWNKSFPYQLVIAKKEGEYYNTVSRFTLPIPPQDMQITTPFAITATQTLGGVIEEHNGAPIRNISFSGTTGVLPLRGTAAMLTSPAGFWGNVSSVFAGTVEAAKRTATAATEMISGQKYESNILSDEELRANDQLAGTGYYQFRLLQLFLEGYVNLKRTAQGKDLRLALCVWKDQAVYLVTPLQFDVKRSSGSPFEYMYSMAFRAWGRIQLEGSPGSLPPYQIGVLEPNWLKRVYDRILSARETIQGAADTVTAFRADVDSALFEPLRQVIAGVKDMMGVAASVADLPKAIASDLQGVIDEAIALGNDGTQGNKVPDPTTTEHGVDAAGKLTPLQAPGSPPTRGASFGSGGNLPPVMRPEYNGLSISKLKLNSAQLQKIKKEQKRIQDLTKADYQSMRSSIAGFANSFAATMGISNTTFNNVYGLTSTQPIKTTPSEQDIAALGAMNELVIALDKIILSVTENNLTFTPMEYMAGLARRSGIAFNVPTSKFAVPFPYGSTLEMLAARYLGDPQRWLEIAALNGLQSPYVDEEGFELSLAVNGVDNQVVVPYSKWLYVGQPVWVYSNTVSRAKRIITSIVSFGSNLIVKLNGDPTLGSYRVIDQARLHAYLPNTVNSQMLIYIPSDKPAREDTYQTDSIPTGDESQELLAVGGIDLLLTESLDLVVSSNGDGFFSVGMNNLIQRLKIGLATPKGSLLQHPSFGFNVAVGSSVADSDPKDILQGLKDFVASDSAFSGLQSANIVRNGPVTQIMAAVGIVGVSNYVPVVTNVR